jgi:transcriptional regulator with XRE-family HTH domain
VSHDPATSPDPKRALVAFGREVRRRRMAQGLSLEALGEAADLTPSFIGGIEMARRNPSLLSMLSIARGLGAPLGELLGMPELSAEGIEGARLLDALPIEVRAAILHALHTLAEAWQRMSSRR